jgi:putative transposase
MPDSLEQLDLLLLTVAKGRKVQQDGIHFQGLRYFDLTLAAYVGEDVLIRYDPLDLAEIRVFHGDRFLCRAICSDLAGTEIGLKDIIQARSARRRELRSTIKQRLSLVETVMTSKQATTAVQEEENTRSHKRSSLKRYHND